MSSLSVATLSHTILENYEGANEFNLVWVSWKETCEGTFFSWSLHKQGRTFQSHRLVTSTSMSGGKSHVPPGLPTWMSQFPPSITWVIERVRRNRFKGTSNVASTNIDATKAMLSQSTSSPFASQHGNSPPERLDTAKYSASRSEESSALNSSSSTVPPITKPTDGAFDFHRFLDQMKSKSADPVSKYLR